MKRIMSGVLLFVLGLGLLAGTTCVATEAVVNGDFSSNAALYTTYPGYNGGPNPAAIDNWSASDVGIGINGSGISTAFGPADKSAATYYAFIQNGGKSLSQDITLSADTAYNVSFLAANRSGESAATGRVVVADASATYYDSGASAWDTTAFQRITDYFITPASIDGTITITLANESGGGGGTVCYSDVAIEPRAPVAATGGNSTYNVGGDRVHEFTSDGTFSVTTGGDIEVLVVAGGGGSGNNGGGGGGAGGVIYDRVFTVVAGSNYTVTVGSGGAGAGSGSVPGSSGTNSIFGPLTSTGGGGGASRDGGGAGVSGGSGGGGGGGGQPQATAGTASPAGQGNKGGGGYNSGGSSAGGGGGGYGSAGTAGASLQGGNGGNGFWSDITGVNTGYAGGGAGSGLASFGGEAGSVEVGAGGGGPENGSRDARSNSGGGGGGIDGTSGGGSGGSGIVIIRYISGAPAGTLIIFR